jgi:hypothetical protein
MITHYEAKRIANAHFRSESSRLVAAHAHRDREYDVWVVDYSDPRYPGERLDGGALVVTDDGEVHSMGSTPDSLDKLMMELGRTSRMDPRPSGTDAEALLLLADENPEEAKS